MAAVPDAPLVSAAVPGRFVASPRGLLAMPMRGLKADWKRWSLAERISAVAIVAIVTFAYGLTLVEALAG
jgi:hypothetical protein